jgi:Big-like domain-containing protein
MVSHCFSRFSRLAPWVVAVVLCVACGDDGPLFPTIFRAVSEVSVTPSNATMAVGGRFTFEVKLTVDPSVTDKDVTWSSSEAGVASLIPFAGGVTVTGLKEGTTTVTATSNADSRVKGSAVVKVIPVDIPPPPPPPTTPTPAPTPAPQPLTGLFDVTATQRAPVNTCFIPGYTGTVVIDELGHGEANIEIQYTGPTGINIRRYFGIFLPTDGTFFGTTSDGRSSIRGKLTGKADGTVSIDAEETLNPCATVPGSPVFGILGQRRK